MDYVQTPYYDMLFMYYDPFYYSSKICNKEMQYSISPMPSLNQF